MLTIRDHSTGFLFDPWDHLGPKRRQLLEGSWAGVFRDFLLQKLPADKLAAHFCEGFGRPSKDLHMVLGALILQQLHDLTDAQTVEAVAFNVTWHYALDIRCETDAYICERSLRNYRRLLIDKQLDEILFGTLTDALIDAIGADTRKQRLDSTGICSFMRSLTRLGILVETTSRFLRELRRVHPDLSDKVAPKIWSAYVDREGDGGFALGVPSDSKRRLPEAAADVYVLLRQFEGTAASALESFQLLDRVFEEQCEVGETSDEQVEILIRDPQDISCDNVLNPSDPDVSYNKHRGVGYLVQVMETYSDDEAAEMHDNETALKSDIPKPDLITHVSVGKMTEHDGAALVPALEDTRAREIAPKLLLADTHYGSNECVKETKARGTDLIAPSMPPKGSKQGKLTLEDFELDEIGRILRCPQGHAPLQASISNKRLQAQFDTVVCGACPFANACVAGGKDRLQYTHDRVNQRRRRLAQREPYFKDRYRWRAGVEATMSRLKHQMGLGSLRVRGMAIVKYTVRLRALGLNIHRVAVWRQRRNRMAA